MDLSAFSPAVRELLAGDRLPALGPGTPNRAVQTRLRALTPADLFAPATVRRPDFAAACLAGLWLHHDFLDASHVLSQGLDTVEGSYWHAIMHRREPDHANAAYWFRRVGEHPIFELLAKDASQLGYRLDFSRWNPFAFIDLCEAHRGTGTEQEMLLRRIQQKEWELLFDWCFRKGMSED